MMTFYDIRPGNGAGLFFQPRNLHGVTRDLFAVANLLVIL